MATLEDLNTALRTIDPHAKALLILTQWTNHSEVNIVALHNEKVLLEQCVPYEMDKNGKPILTEEDIHTWLDDYQKELEHYQRTGEYWGQP